MACTGLMPFLSIPPLTNPKSLQGCRCHAFFATPASDSLLNGNVHNSYACIQLSKPRCSAANLAAKTENYQCCAKAVLNNQ